MTESTRVARATTLLGLAAVLAGCEIQVPVGGDDVSSPDGAASQSPPRLCEAAGSSTITGTGPGGSLDGYHAFANVRGGQCRAAIELVLTPDPALRVPYHPGTVVITTRTPADLLLASADLAGTLRATITDRTGEVAAEGKIEILQATPADGVGETRLRAIASFDAPGWQLTAVVDLPYCLIDECPCCEIPL